jgi:hypothetical protein
MVLMQSAGAAGQREPLHWANDSALLTEVLRVYKPHCRYLRSATVEYDEGVLLGKGEFSIPESCYIQDTGHFNCVEFNISFNQMAYYLIAKSIKEHAVAAFGGWTLSDYWTKQLSDMYIATFECAFRQPMSARKFFGEVAFVRLNERRGATGRQPLVWIDATCSFWDDDGGRSNGRVQSALTNPPST